MATRANRLMNRTASRRPAQRNSQYPYFTLVDLSLFEPASSRRCVEVDFARLTCSTRTEVAHPVLAGRQTNLVLVLQTAVVIIGMMAQGAQGQTYDVGMPPGNNYDQAQFRLWVPDELETVRAVLAPGSNGDGRGQVETQLWQELAEDEDLALVGLHMTDRPHDDMFIEHYVDVANGSGGALLAAPGELGSMSGHTEIESAPLLLWGMSAGGEFNYEFALWKPERVAAFVVNKDGIYYSALTSREAGNVPGLIFVGDKDPAFCNDIIRGVFSINRRAGA